MPELLRQFVRRSLRSIRGARMRSSIPLKVTFLCSRIEETSATLGYSAPAAQQSPRRQSMLERVNQRLDVIEEKIDLLLESQMR